MRYAPLVLVLVLVLFTTGCADANLAEDNLEVCVRGVSGFWSGLWHGFIAPWSFLGSIITEDIAIYDICNNGGWYDFGFCLGIGAFTKGSHSAAKRRRWSRKPKNGEEEW